VKRRCCLQRAGDATGSLRRHGVAAESSSAVGRSVRVARPWVEWTDRFVNDRPAITRRYFQYGPFLVSRQADLWEHKPAFFLDGLSASGACPR